MKELALTLKRKYLGYFSYYGVIGNSDRLWRYWNASRRIIFRRTQPSKPTESYNWIGFESR